MKTIKRENVIIKDYSDEVMEQLEDAKKKILQSIGITAEGLAKKYETAVDTGRLRNSITWAVKSDEGKQFSFVDDKGQTHSYTFGSGAEDDAVYIGTKVEYAKYIEFGVHGRAGIHFLQKAVFDNNETYKKIIDSFLK